MVKATNKEFDERVEFVIQMVAKCFKKHEIKKVFRSKYAADFDGEASARQIERYIAAAREEIVRRANRPKDDLLGESISFWEMAIRDPETDMRTKMEARAKLDNIYGLNAPVTAKVEHSGAFTPAVIQINVIPSRTSEEQLAVVANVTGQLEEAGRPVLTDGDD